MAKNKIRKFQEFDALPNTFDSQSPKIKGKWNEIVFQNQQPIVLELACGRGEYSLGLGKLYPNKNYIGVDIKGSRMWNGSTYAHANRLTHIAFLRTQIELIEGFFAKNEVSEIWIIFPDPQPQLSRAKKRLTSTRFLNVYRNISNPDTIVNLKTDSELLYDFTKEIIMEQNLEVIDDIPNIYEMEAIPEFLKIETYYEKLWLGEKRIIKFLSFKLHNNKNIVP
jgi:tRNA (guanine-N7-)-methyltransferase